MVYVRIATHAFKLAMVTLSNLTAHPPPYDHEPFSQSSTSQAPSFLSSYLPSAQGQGPIGRAIRIVIKLRQKYSPFRILSWTDGSAAASRKKDEEIRGKAIKVIDLLQYSAELGNTDALYTLARLSLVRFLKSLLVSCFEFKERSSQFPPNVYFTSDPKLAYSYFATHASLTGNATSQALLAFFHATGYADTVPVDQARAIDRKSVV